MVLFHMIHMPNILLQGWPVKKLRPAFTVAAAYASLLGSDRGLAQPPPHAKPSALKFPFQGRQRVHA